MITNSNVILICIILAIVFFMFLEGEESNKINASKSKYGYKKKMSGRTNRGGIIEEELVDDVISWDSKSTNVVKKPLNPNFLDIQFHNDYRDVLTAINNLVPDKRQRFNIANIPLQFSEPEVAEVKLIIKDFLAVLNNNIVTAVPDVRNGNSGWDEAIVDPTVESGWDKLQRSLGLPVSLYDKPAGKCRVFLVDITHVEKRETVDETKYTIDFVIQKENIDDQMALKCSFVEDKRPLEDENNFFVSKNIETKIVIEDAFVSGYLSKEGPDSKQQSNNDGDKEKFYELDEMEYNNMMDPKYIQKVLMDKYRVRTREMEQRNALLDEYGQEFHKSLPHLYDFSNVRDTRTIFDDFNKPKEFM